MRMDLPGCDLHDCRYHFDGNCIKADKGKRWLWEECPHTRASRCEEENVKLKIKVEELKKMSKSEKLDLYRKAFCLYVNWAKECDFGYDNLIGISEKYEKEFEKKGIGYIEGLMLIAIKEARGDFPKSYLEEIESVEKELMGIFFAAEHKGCQAVE